MMHVDSLQRYWHRNKEQTLAADSIFFHTPAKHTGHVSSQSFTLDNFLCDSNQLKSGGSILLWWGEPSVPLYSFWNTSQVVFSSSSIRVFYLLNKTFVIWTTPLKVAFGSARKELMIKPAQGVTTGPEYNKLEGERNEKRWHAYKKRHESRGKQMMSSTYKFFIYFGWLEWLSCDLTTNPVCKLLFIFRKVCQTRALIFYPDFPLVARSRTCSPHNLWLPLVLMTDY